VQRPVRCASITVTSSEEFRKSLNSQRTGLVLALHARPLRPDNRVARNFYRISLLESINWTWGLSLIALTMAIHATALSFIAFGLA
jgi:hypothetical protein